MERTLIWLRLACLTFGAVAGILLQGKAIQRHFPQLGNVGVQLLQLMSGITKTVICCAAAVVILPIPVPVSILYTGAGLLAAHIVAQPHPREQTLPIICAWMILLLPFTGVLACLGGALLVLAADAQGVAGLAILVLGSPMALLQFGPESGLILLGLAALLCARQVMEWKRKNTAPHPG